MRLTRVEIHGFKSFADRTALDLPPGFTAIVGPNGCGKSNVIDAIKWALGEQRASALRGKVMVDVVFKGNGARAQRNFAEVSLHLDNQDGSLPTEYSEVVITRRLFRTGESEYLLNRQPARLKDVRDLLLDTGLGTGAYSVMEQGRIDAVLSVNPVERRRIFEEAAGISKYRARRRESESRLERTEQNLLRLSDVVDELEKRQRSLKIQAGRARSFLEVRDRLREVRSVYSRVQWLSLGTTLAAQQAELGRLVEVEGRTRRDLDLARAELAALSERQSQLRREVDERAERFRQASGEVEAVGERQSALRERSAEAQAGAERLAQRLAGLEAALGERRDEAVRLEQRLAELTREARTWDDAVSAAESARDAAQAVLTEAETSARIRREASLVAVARLTELRGLVAQAAARHAGLSASAERVEEQVAGLARQSAEHSRLAEEFQAGVQDVESQRAQAGARAATQASRLGDLRAQVQQADETLAGQRESLAAANSRRQALEELIERRDGVAKAALDLLGARLPGVEGLLVDQLRAPRRLAEAVEAALGAGNQAVLVADRRAGLAALAHVAGARAGRVLLVPRAGLAPRVGAAPGPRLLDQLKVQDHAPVFEALLGHVRLVADRAALEQVAPDGVTVWVTPAGELQDERGLLRGGAAGQDAGLVLRRAERDELVERCAELAATLAAGQDHRRAAVAAMAEAEGLLAAEQQRQRQLDAECERVRERSLQLGERRVALERDLAARQQELARLTADGCAARAGLDQAQADEAVLESEVSADRAAETTGHEVLRRLGEVLGARHEALSAARLEQASRRERHDALVNESRQVSRSLEERAAELSRNQKERDELIARSAGLDATQADLAARATGLADEADRRAGELNDARKASALLGESLERGAAAVAAAESLHEAAAGSLAEHRLASQETSIRRDELRRKVLEELELDLDGLEPLEPREPAADGTALAVEIDELRTRLSRMGNVNLEAVDELAEVEQRLQFLVGQRDDLLAAKAALADTIGRLDLESRERFRTTFEEVRGHFRQVFRKLFRGGRADMALEEGVDLLDAGIEITAAPPGKDPRTITLLSGGERTLTAVGLLFSLFRARPSPVCLLDEVDAALDETNIERFCSVLEDFLGATQFLVVTHARRTMSYADQVFGVTMAEHGVSKVLSLTVEEYEASQARASRRVSAEAAAADGLAEPRAALRAAVEGSGN